MKKQHISQIININNSAVRTAKILKAFGSAQRPIGITELAHGVNLAPSVTYRIVVALEQEGLLEQDPETKKYWISLTLLNIASAVPQQLALGRHAYRYMDHLNKISGETINLGILRKTKILYLSKIDSNQLLRTTVSIGSTAEAHSTAIGKVILAFQSEAEQAQYMSNASFERFGPNTIIMPNELVESLKNVRAEGIAIDDEECSAGTRAIAAPIRDNNGRVVAGLAISGPRHRFAWKQIEVLKPELIAAANKISQELGYEHVSLTMDLQEYSNIDFERSL